MQRSRRQFLFKFGQWAGALAAASLLRPVAALAAELSKEAFSAKSLDGVVSAFGGSGAKESADIVLSAPEIAENGAVVPIAVSSKLAGTKSISILVEKNPGVLAARFEFPEGTDPDVSTRVKVSETSNVIALVETSDGYFFTQKPVKVTLGGCGG